MYNIMTMIPYTRKEKIVELIEKKEMVYIDDIMQMMPDVSESTVRRDLQSLAREGRLILLRGGAARLKPESSFDLPLETKMVINIDAKEKISKYAASLVKDGDVIYLDSSTTVLPMVKYLGDMKITVVTSGTHIPSLIRSPHIKCIILGGEVMNEFGSIVGPITESLLSSMFFDKSFMGANGFSLNGGISSPHFAEAAKMKIIQRNSKITYMMMDGTKAGITTFCKVFDLGECNIITDVYSDILENFKSHIVVS